VRSSPSRQGFVLVTVLSVLAVLAMLVAAYFVTTQIETTTSKANADGTTGFYAAEAGLNLRGEQVRQIFQDYNLPSGTSPSTSAPCTGGDEGTGDFACKSYTVSGRTVRTYVVGDPANGSGGASLTIPPNERFAGLSAQEFRYTVVSAAYPPNGSRPEAIVKLVFKSRLVPLFQFTAFYNKDLEILPGADMTLNGPVHVNGDLYLSSDASLKVDGDVTVSKRSGGTGGDLYRRRKDGTDCNGTVSINDGSGSYPQLFCGDYGPVPASTLAQYNGHVQTGLEPLTVPSPNELDPGNAYWQKADLVVELRVDSSGNPTGIVVPNRTGGGENSALTSVLNACPARNTSDLAFEQNGGAPAGTAVDWSNSSYDNRESHKMTLLEVDMGALLDCLHEHPGLFGDSASGKTDIGGTSLGGLVLYFTVAGPDSGQSSSSYGVRIRDGATLASDVSGAPQVKGVTVVTDQAAYIQGDYNKDAGGAWRPASVLSDTINLLSNNWNTKGWDAKSAQGLSSRSASTTEVNAAFLSGTDTTGGVEGAAGQGGAYSGGIENYPRFHENWTGKTLTYDGSFVSLGNARHADGPWQYGGAVYTAPQRNWSFDTRFRSAANLPPLAPRFVYLKQERFSRVYQR
jgi:hypothetical protein